MSERERDPDVLWAALKLACKWAAMSYYAEESWQQILKRVLREARDDVSPAASSPPASTHQPPPQSP